MLETGVMGILGETKLPGLFGLSQQGFGIPAQTAPPTAPPPLPRRRPGRQDIGPEHLRPVVDEVLREFPRVGNFDFAIRQRPRVGDEPLIESFSPDEPMSPNFGTRTLELRGNDLQGTRLKNAIAGDMLHHLGSGGPDSISGGTRPVNDPEYRKLKQEFVDAFPQEERNWARKRYEQHKTAHPQERRSFEDWFDTVWADMWIGGLITPVNDEFLTNAPKVLDPRQVKIVDAMKRLLQRERR